MMSEEIVAMSYVIKDDAEAENIQASIWNTRVTEGSYMQQTLQEHSFSKPSAYFAKVFFSRSSLVNSGVSSLAPPCVRLHEIRPPHLLWNISVSAAWLFDSTEMFSPGCPNESSQQQNKLRPEILIGSGGVAPLEADNGLFVRHWRWETGLHWRRYECATKKLSPQLKELRHYLGS